MEKLGLNVVIVDWRGLKSWGAAGAGSAGQDIPVAKSTYMYDEPVHSAACSLKGILHQKMPKIDTLDALEEHEEHEDDYQTNSNW